MITITYEELFDYDKLYRGHLRGRLSKRDKKPLVRFEMNMLDNLSFLHDRIKDGKYKSGKYSTFTIRVPKQREIQTQPYDNRVV